MAKIVHRLTTRRDHGVGFFDCKTTENAIIDLASATSVTFFLGAGVSADQEVPTWADLVARLMETALPEDLVKTQLREPSGQSTGIARALIRRYFQLPMATAIDGLLKEKFGHRGYINERNKLLRQSIYRKADRTSRDFLRNPSLAREVVLSAILLKACGKDVHILTTNYDHAIEEISRDDVDARRDADYWGIEFQTYADGPPDNYISELEIPVVHVHGSIGRRSRPSLVVFSEPDYAKWAKRTEVLDYVRRRFADTRLLMIGASLRDHNIISYLSETNWNLAHRYALLPLQGDSAHDIGRLVGFEPISAIQEHRADELGISGLFPDFYGQVHQFLIELGYAAGQAIDGSSYAANSYGKRIRLWADDFERCASDEDYRKDVTRTLRDLAKEIRTRVPEAEQVKIEVWTRRNVDGRTLELWCNSQSTHLGDDYWPNERRIIKDVTAPAVHSFSNRTAVSGRVVDRQDGRWTHYVASTVMIDQEPYSSLPIGAAVTLFHAPGITTDVLPSVESKKDEIVRIVLDEVEQILNPTT
jgi:hypothetical protein